MSGTKYLDIIYSPDDDGWYAEEYDFEKKIIRISRKIYRTRNALICALETDKHGWESA